MISFILKKEKVLCPKDIAEHKQKYVVDIEVDPTYRHLVEKKNEGK